MTALAKFLAVNLIVYNFFQFLNIFFLFLSLIFFKKYKNLINHVINADVIKSVWKHWNN